MTMKKLLPASVAALFLATGTAHAFWKIEKWECRMTWDGNDPLEITATNIAEIKKELETLKKHCAYLQCLQDRSAGKVKHCYENDKRWRTQFYPPVKAPPWTENKEPPPGDHIQPPKGDGWEDIKK